MLIHGRTLGHEALHINVPAGILGAFQRNGRPGAISASIRLERAPRPTDGRSEGRTLEPLLTVQRWAEEAKMLHGKFEQTRWTKLHNHVAIALLPASVEAPKKAKEAEEREQERLREEQARAAEEAAKKEQEAVEAAEKAKREEEERAAEAAAQAAAEAEANAAAQEATVTADSDVEMADESSTSPAVPTPENGPETAESSARQEEAPAPAQERVTVLIHGEPVDITDTGIDPTFLEALPD